MSSNRRRSQYEEYINSPAWKVKREEAFLFHGKKCNRCPSTKNLHVHHRNYKSFKNELMSDLEVLCKDCHNAHHGRGTKQKRRKVKKRQKKFMPHRRPHRGTLVPANDYLKSYDWTCKRTMAIEYQGACPCGCKKKYKLMVPISGLTMAELITADYRALSVLCITCNKKINNHDYTRNLIQDPARGEGD